MSFGNNSEVVINKGRDSSKRLAIAFELLDECTRQVDKWGEQNWPMYSQLDLFDHNQEYGVELTADNAKGLCDHKSGDRSLSWFDITTEEYLEARDEALAGNAEKLRAELVQTAACIISAIASLDRNGIGGNSGE